MLSQSTRQWLAPSRRAEAEAARKRPATVRLQVEALEERCLLSVLGADDRTLVANTTAFPWRAVVRVVVTWPNGASTYGSGAMVSQRHVLTAAHVIYNAGRGGWAETVAVTPGQKGSYKPYGTAFKAHLRSFKSYTHYRKPDYDVGLVTLDRSIGAWTGWFGMKPDYVKRGTGVNTAGYPGDRGKTYMYKAYGPISYLTSSDRIAKYKGKLDTYGGQSGGPLWRYNSATGTRWIVGVHTGNSGSYNRGVVLTRSKFNTIVSWIRADSARASTQPASRIVSSVSTNATAAPPVATASAAYSATYSFDVSALASAKPHHEAVVVNRVTAFFSRAATDAGSGLDAAPAGAASRPGGSSGQGAASELRDALDQLFAATTLPAQENLLQDYGPWA